MIPFIKASRGGKGRVWVGMGGVGGLGGVGDEGCVGAGVVGGIVCVVWVSALGMIGSEAVIVVSVSASVGTGTFLAQELNTRTEAIKQTKTSEQTFFIFVSPSFSPGSQGVHLKQRRQ